MLDKSKCGNVLLIYLLVMIGACVVGCSSMSPEGCSVNLQVIDEETCAGIAGAAITVFPVTPLVFTERTKAGGNCALRCRMQSIVRISINAQGYIGVEMTRDEIVRALDKEGTAIIRIKRRACTIHKSSAEE